ncbi:MAG: tetratricopeptide repeat protein [Flavobacteriales bacterium]|nr:tetratricopeptide repeat protein [Flavobacteriales bacterium]
MKKFVILLCLSAILFIQNSFAQVTAAEQKIIKKSLKQYEKKKFDKAAELLKPIVYNHTNIDKLWELFVEYHYQDYLARGVYEQNLMGNITVTTNSEDSAEIAQVESLKELFASMFVYPPITQKMLSTMREATRYSPNQSQSSMVLRAVFIDPKLAPEKSENRSAWKKFNLAEQQFQAKNFASAAEYYKEVQEIDPDFYQAWIYEGDSYYFMGKYKEAAEIFQAAADEFPDLLEPQKYLCDAFDKLEDYEMALEAALDGILRYPDADMFSRIEGYCDVLDKKFDQKWQPRPIEVNKMKKYQYGFFISPDSSYEDHWKLYQKGFEEIKPFANDSGIITANDKSEYYTIEAYAWNYMLENADGDIDELKAAREMKEAGMLEQYVLISNFHFDLFSQFKWYVLNHQDQAAYYLKTLIE